jgi:hypothetical protein
MGWSLFPFYLSKLTKIAQHARHLIGRATRNARWLPGTGLQPLACKAQSFFLGNSSGQILPPRTPLRRRREVGRPRPVNSQLRRDFQRWTKVPCQSNGKPIHKPVETAYLHTDSSAYGWGAVLNEELEARGLWSKEDEQQHITWKERKAVRHAVESFLPQLAGRNVLMHEDNQAVCHSQTILTSRSHVMMEELRRMWCLLDTNNINLKARCIKSPANVWADKLNRYLDIDDRRLDPVILAKLDMRFGQHTIDRFASAPNTLQPRYNVGWRDPTCEEVDALYLLDEDMRRENNWCNPPLPPLLNLVQKLRQSGASATVVPPRWTRKVWHQARTEMASEEIIVAPRRDLFKRGSRRYAVQQAVLTSQ